MRMLNVIVFMSVVCFSLSFAQDSSNVESSADLEILVGNQVYDATLGDPVAVTTPGGEKVQIIVKKKELVSFNNYGVSFFYNNDMTLSLDEDEGVATITLESTQSPLAIVQVYSVDTTPQEVRNALINSFKNEYSSRNVKFLENTGTTLSQNFSGVKTEGELLDFMLAGQRMQSEVYAFQKGNDVVAVVFQYDLEDGDLAAKYFSPITKTLK
jgi:hypothetical protein